MRIHHLDCGSMCPPSALLVNGEGSLFARGSMVCHCLLIETGRELILVDTGFGTDDVKDPRRRLGGQFLQMTSPRLSHEQTALAQVEKLGFKREDVRHIVLTHLDPDHAGGLSDFPEAAVHVFTAEHQAADQRATYMERRRYRFTQWAHNPRWADHGLGGDKWMGFDSVQAVGQDVLLVPTAGHTRGHCAVAVRDEVGWLLHAGDAYFFRDEMNAAKPHCTLGLSLFQKIMAFDDQQRKANQKRLRELASDPSKGVRVFCAHDVKELADAQARSAQQAPATAAAQGIG